MRIEDWMSAPVFTVKPLDSIAHAREVMARQEVNQLPVVRGGELVGIVTDRDLRSAFPSVFDQAAHDAAGGAFPADPEEVTVDTVMSSNVLTLEPGDAVEDAVRLMLRERIGAVPIVEGARLVGILARSDVLEAFLALCTKRRGASA